MTLRMPPSDTLLTILAVVVATVVVILCAHALGAQLASP